MFTGIIEATGTVKSLEEAGGDLRAVITSEDLDFSDVHEGDSICVNGVCLTAVNKKKHSFTVDISNETLSLTSFSVLKTGDAVNLEKAMQPSSRFGGHIVSGHVDGLAELASRIPDGRSERLVFSAPAELMKYIAPKGSVCLDGISLTVNDVDGCSFGINIIPHTADVTTIHSLQPGGKVNLEVDIISRYLEKMMTDKSLKGEVPELSLEKLISSGLSRESANEK